MKLQTQIPLSPERNQIDYQSKVLLLGSCFTENIGSKLSYFQFQNLQNPLGIMFHPLAVEALVTRAVNNEQFTKADVFEREGSWFSFEAHSSVSAASEDQMVQLLNGRLNLTSSFLSEATHIVVTLGTAWVYRYMASDTIVANCHKIPQQKFAKELLSVEDCIASLERISVLVRTVNKSAPLLFTVSPVRHLKDGFLENSRSKAHLISAVQGIVEDIRQSHYFPSFELQMDELRDYRFYKEDMIHPSEVAVQYIWEKFKHVWVAAETEKLQLEIDSVQKGLRHRPFQPKSTSHQEFQQVLEQKIEKIRTVLPHVAFK